MRHQLKWIAMSLLLAQSAWAGQPWFGSSTGQFYSWPGGAVSWIYDSGDLAAGYTNAQAVAMVAEAFDIWVKAGLSNASTGQWVSTANLSVTQPGYVPDVTKDNYKKYLSLDSTKPAPDYPPTIIFDIDGSIIADLGKLIGQDMTTVVAYTMINPDVDLDSSSHAITHAVTILNGAMMNKSGIDEDRFKASVIHELGHLLGLDHTGLNDEYATTSDAKKNRTLKTSMDAALPTMYPVNLSAEQKTLHNDDVVALSTLYPTSAFSSQFCTITGKVVDSTGSGVQGIEVVARTTVSNDFAADAISTMTGVEYPIPTRDGHYYIRGIVPKKTYTVGFAPLPAYGLDGSGIGNFSSKYGVAPPGLGMPPIANAPDGRCDTSFPSCDITAAGGTVTQVSCNSGGQLIVMDAVQLSSVTVDKQYASAPVPSVVDPQPIAPAAAASSSGCSLIR